MPSDGSSHHSHFPFTRRDFLEKSIVTSVGLAASWQAASLGGVARAGTSAARVSITKGEDRADNAFRALQMFKKEIAAAIGRKRVVIKPNFVYYSTLLSCTHVACVDGVLEFLKSIGKRDIAIAESSAAGSTMAGFDLNGYWDLNKKYPVKLMDLNQEGFAKAQIWSTGNLSETIPPRTIRVSKLYLNPNNFTTPLEKNGQGLVNFIKIESINGLTGEITITAKIAETEHLGYLKRSQLKKDDILFSIAGTLGRVAVVNEEVLPANTNQALAIVRLSQGDVGYITTYLKGKAVGDFVKKNPTIGAQPNLSLEQVRNLEILLPSGREQQEIGKYFRTLDALISKQATQLEKLKQVKSACLERMFV